MILNLINITKNQEIAHPNLAAMVGQQICDSTRMAQEVERDTAGKEIPPAKLGFLSKATAPTCAIARLVAP